jgi:hypothetical protein
MVLDDKNAQATGLWLLIVAVAVILVALGVLYVMAKESAWSAPSLIPLS